MNAEIESPWVAVSKVCHLYGVGYDTAKNKIAAGTFEVPVYKVGKIWVIDKQVHDAYFRKMRELGLKALA